MCVSRVDGALYIRHLLRVSNLYMTKRLSRDGNTMANTVVLPKKRYQNLGAAGNAADPGVKSMTLDPKTTSLITSGQM